MRHNLQAYKNLTKKYLKIRIALYVHVNVNQQKDRPLISQHYSSNLTRCYNKLQDNGTYTLYTSFHYNINHNLTKQTLLQHYKGRWFIENQARSEKRDQAPIENVAIFVQSRNHQKQCLTFPIKVTTQYILLHCLGVLLLLLLLVIFIQRKQQLIYALDIDRK